MRACLTSSRKALPNRAYCVREMAASAVFVMLYIGAVEGVDRWLAPKHVMRMTGEQAVIADDVAHSLRHDCHEAVLHPHSEAEMRRHLGPGVLFRGQHVSEVRSVRQGGENRPVADRQLSRFPRQFVSRIGVEVDAALLGAETGAALPVARGGHVIQELAIEIDRATGRCFRVGDRGVAGRGDEPVEDGQFRHNGGIGHHRAEILGGE